MALSLMRRVCCSRRRSRASMRVALRVARASRSSPETGGGEEGGEGEEWEGGGFGGGRGGVGGLLLGRRGGRGSGRFVSDDGREETEGEEEEKNEGDDGNAAQHGGRGGGRWGGVGADTSRSTDTGVNRAVNKLNSRRPHLRSPARCSWVWGWRSCMRGGEVDGGIRSGGDGGREENSSAQGVHTELSCVSLLRAQQLRHTAADYGTACTHLYNASSLVLSAHLYPALNQPDLKHPILPLPLQQRLTMSAKRKAPPQHHHTALPTHRNRPPKKQRSTIDSDPTLLPPPPLPPLPTAPAPHFLRFSGSNSSVTASSSPPSPPRPLLLHSLRSHDDAPGLRDYEVSFLRLLESLTTGSTVSINETGTALRYLPGTLTGSPSPSPTLCPPTRGVGYFLTPALQLAPFMSHPLHLTLAGCTHHPLDVSVDLFRAVTLPLAARFLPSPPQLTVTRRAFPHRVAAPALSSVLSPRTSLLSTSPLPDSSDASAARPSPPAPPPPSPRPPYTQRGEC